MARLNFILLCVLTVCALALVTSQHHARKLFIELNGAQDRARSLEVEYGQLQLEQSTWAMHARVQRLAGQALRMKVPEAKRIELVPPAGGTAAKAPTGQEAG